MADAPVDLNTGLLLFIPYRALEMRVFHAVRAAGFTDATPAQFRVFQRIGPHGTRLTELAEAAEVTKQTAGFLVDQLEAAGYVERVPDPADGRARLIRSTTRGAAVTSVAAVAVAEVEAEWTTHLGARGMASLRRQLERLREITDPWA
ncbi:MarR family winged helix-turn-helix transcriptional regulator [Oerskovia sp. NPDC060338]|uniref:MarR family winged helix-turn-helix transcriptional regulator n=1 Tax=Oerskovia sp. NPDC060338 TaxID=3347100 RepID=UPI003662A0F3